MMVIRRYDRYLYLCVWFQRYRYKMVLESTIICVDNSEYTRNGDYLPTRLQAQQASYALVFPSVGSEFILLRTRILFINQDPLFLAITIKSCQCFWPQCCGSEMFIPDPDFLPIPDRGSRIPDPKTSASLSIDGSGYDSVFYPLSIPL
jgi:hypothetical protein